jgi:WD40 repeat protein
LRSRRIDGEDGNADEMRFSADSRRLITLSTRDGTHVKTFDAATGRRLSAFQVEMRKRGREDYNYVDSLLSPDGSLLATEDVEVGRLSIRESASGRELRKLENISDGNIELQFSPRGDRLAACSNIRQGNEDDWQWQTSHVKVWDVHEGRTVWEGRPQGFYSFKSAFSSDCRLLAMPGRLAEKPAVKLWNIDQRRALPDLTLDEECNDVHFSPDGSCLLTIYRLNRVVMKVWDVATAVELFTLDDSNSDRSGATLSGDAGFLPDGRRIVTTGDGTLKLWDARDGQLVLTLRPAQQPFCISADGRRLIAAAPSAAIYIWQSP